MSILRVLSVHGVSTSVIPISQDYAQALEENIVRQLIRLKVIPQQASQSQINEVISFDRADYSDIGATERQRIFTDYQQEAARLENVLDKALNTVIIDSLRRLLIGAGGNVLIYESNYWKDEIRQRVLDRITPYVNVDGAISLIGHSLGSVVAFDVAYYNSCHNPDWLKHNFFVSNLFTLGSPIALFTLDTQDDSGQPKSRYVQPDAFKVVRENGVWYNFFDAQDIIGYPLEKLYPNHVRDLLVQTGTSPLHAHTNYWWNEEVAAKIAERLKLDYERVTGQKV